LANPSPNRKASRAASRKSIKGVDISPDERVSLYAQSRYLPSSFLKKSGLQLPFATYFQDPFVAREDPSKAIDDKVFVAWEPGLTDGPTSSRFAIVDYNADTGVLEAPAIWDESSQKFVSSAGKPLGAKSASTFQFHQVSVWALLQRALAFFEDGSGLGRTVPWAFEGNRLIVVPHAGYGENAYYDRRSKSLQFYYFGSANEEVFTCLSVDIVNHEFGHAVLDGVRPLFNESSNVQTAGFHEFVGDLTAILLTLQNGTLRRQLAVASRGRFDKATEVSALAEEFGSAVQGRPYLRTALNKYKMGDMANETSAHRLSQVLTGSMFDVLIALGEHYQRASGDRAARTPKQAFWYAADRMQRMAIQPFDLLPPVEVTFRDYALAVCRSQQLSDPIDPEGYYDLLIKVFRNRQVLTAEDEKELKEPRYLNERIELSVHHNMDDISRSRAAAYRFLDDNREDLLIPANRDFFISDLYDATKYARQNVRLPRQIVIQYAWREEVPLDGLQFGRFNGGTTTMLCGGTLVFSEDGIVSSWVRKPGSHSYGGKRSRTGRVAAMWGAAVAEGTARRQELLANIATQVAAGRIGDIAATAKGLLGSQTSSLTAAEDGGLIQFQLVPHLHLSEDKQEDETEDLGERQWEISC
jgi:hypothetical protein